MGDTFDSKSGGQNVGQGDHAIGKQNNNYGITPALFAEYAGKLSVTDAALASFFKILEEQQVLLHDLDSKLREIAAQHKELLARVGGNQAAKQAIEAGDYAKAEELLEDVVRQHSMAAAEANAAQAHLQRIQYRHAKAAAYWQKAAALLPEDKKQERAQHLHSAAFDLDRVARYSEALSLYEQSLDIRREIGDKEGEGTTLNNISQIYEARGDYSAALTYLEQSLAIRREIGDKAGEGVTLNNIGCCYVAQDDMRKAELHISHAVQFAKEIDYPRLVEMRMSWALDKVAAMLWWRLPGRLARLDQLLMRQLRLLRRLFFCLVQSLQGK
jgi:tetratricopeptide (TPR) repeat protein